MPGALIDEAPARALAVYAHPDDPEVSCGGTLARWAGEGTEVHVLICAKGEKGSDDPSVKPAELARRRGGEMRRAAGVLGLAERSQLAIADGELENTVELRHHIVAAVRRVRPEVVLCPDPTAVFFGDSYFNHRDHRVTGWATLDAVAPAAANPHYFPGTGAPHQVRTVLLSASLDPDAWVDISATVEIKIAALACHESQLGAAGEAFRTFVRERGAEQGEHAGVPYAEGFRRLNLAG